MKKRKNIRKKVFGNVNWQMLIFLVIVLCLALFFIKNQVLVSKEDFKFKGSNSGSVMLPAVFEYKDLGLIEARKIFDENKNNPDFVIIDVSSNYKLGHIPGSLGYPLLNSFDDVLNNFDRDKSYFVYSWNGLDSSRAAQMLIDSGFEKVYRLRDNYGAWIVAGYPIERN
jgi:thiosulfate sulfurtransferase